MTLLILVIPATVRSLNFYTRQERMAIFSPYRYFYSTMLVFWCTMLLCREQTNIWLFFFFFFTLLFITDCMPSKPSLTCFMVFPWTDAFEWSFSRNVLVCAPCEHSTCTVQLWMGRVWKGGETYHWFMGMACGKHSHSRWGETQAQGVGTLEVLENKI